MWSIEIFANVFAAALNTAWLEGSDNSNICINNFILIFPIYLWKFYEHDRLLSESILYILHAFSSEFNELTNKSIIPILIKFWRYFGFKEIHEIILNAYYLIF